MASRKIPWTERIFDTVNVIILLFIVLATVYPLYYVLMASLSEPARFLAHGVQFVPAGFSLEAYKSVLHNPMIGYGYRNTILILAAGLSVNIILTVFAGFVFSRKGAMLVKPITLIALFTMFFSGGMIPNYLQVEKLGLVDSLFALILPTAVSTYNCLIMRTAFLGIPLVMEEAARIDGANDITILVKILTPLVVPTMAVLTLYYGVGHWNAWFNAMLYIRTRTLYPLQLVLREILILSDTGSMTTAANIGDKLPLGETIKYATIIVSTLPILALYPFLQKYFVKGVMIGAVKG